MGFLIGHGLISNYSNGLQTEDKAGTEIRHMTSRDLNGHTVPGHPACWPKRGEGRLPELRC